MIFLKGTTTIKHNLSPSQEFLNSPVKSESKKYHHKTDYKITRLSLDGFNVESVKSLKESQGIDS